jgi:hypothetical protein
MFKFQVSGAAENMPSQPDTWLGVTFSPEQARELAEMSGFEWVRSEGAGTQYYWLWFRKPDPQRRAPVEKAGPAITIEFQPSRVSAGDSYQVRVPGFENQTIDIGWELGDATGVVGKWCGLDSKGEAVIAVPKTHPPGMVRISKVRSRTAGGPLQPASGSIEVLT